MDITVIVMGLVVLLLVLGYVWFKKTIWPWYERLMAERDMKIKIHQDQINERAAERLAERYKKKGKL
ncbi:hypothetical protein E3O44_12740 [Cryobacterium algoricola]|uniref:Uncharacterized protein n=1 Tax=Cryobacterium algoricola TaxID=1259183 RepID=A0ABY2IE35_9MICO|nr:hypothetical protein [Cryobacterium algoricola]TFB85863.1 hypothetical protein E3O44_12740 [Cryobacterium algoricola]